MSYNFAVQYTSFQFTRFDLKTTVDSSGSLVMIFNGHSMWTFKLLSGTELEVSNIHNFSWKIDRVSNWVVVIEDDYNDYIHVFSEGKHVNSFPWDVHGERLDEVGEIVQCNYPTIIEPHFNGTERYIKFSSSNPNSDVKHEVVIEPSDKV